MWMDRGRKRSRHSMNRRFWILVTTILGAVFVFTTLAAFVPSKTAFAATETKHQQTQGVQEQQTQTKTILIDLSAVSPSVIFSARFFTDTLPSYTLLRRFHDPLPVTPIW